MAIVNKSKKKVRNYVHIDTKMLLVKAKYICVLINMMTDVIIMKTTLAASKLTVSFFVNVIKLNRNS